MGTDVRLNLDRTTQSDAGYLVSADKDSALAVPQYGGNLLCRNTEEPAVPQYGGNLLCRNVEETCCAAIRTSKPILSQQ
jgi:hypothetical protein